ncbi:B-cell receptor-associated protein 31 [Odontomachus brunneus]|uniref:B-cell receptor-associated protein 31 n=1 Tax=Odontomachus brunneus TaxID=486640 RepID=UPI0013F23EA3|nr:B-cell receptor-associated protein 31 [Odontomachus brunneus]XP_032682163.1 B-cell receptor-associated protein 31 [Odontomachus brunneus]XP_032682164.1 B-cell receptor-associated protein 31 [Odontomachus brunneus]XP_032682165.1 B-cell receptor-associated protein 31 [Odontomachus brunneus]XP_032682166.1 B-cell receptor-associated protein 31 [Odontomachus brunneus]
MSLQWKLIAGFLYLEVTIVLMLVLPVASPTRWQRLFKSRFLQSISNRASIYFVVLLGVLVLFLLDAIREMRKYSTSLDHTEHHHNMNLEMQENMRLFRAQRNFYISGFALFLSLVIRRLVLLISIQANLLAQNEAAMRQAQSATTTARSLLSQRTIGESAQNDSNEAHDKAVSELKNQIKELQAKNLELENELTKEKKDKDAMKSQADSLAKEYDRLSSEHAKVAQSNGDKKSD